MSETFSGITPQVWIAIARSLGLMCVAWLFVRALELATRRELCLRQLAMSESLVNEGKVDATTMSDFNNTLLATNGIINSFRIC